MNVWIPGKRLMKSVFPCGCLEDLYANQRFGISFFIRIVFLQDIYPGIFKKKDVIFRVGIRNLRKSRKRAKNNSDPKIVFHKVLIAG